MGDYGTVRDSLLLDSIDFQLIYCVIWCLREAPPCVILSSLQQTFVRHTLCNFVLGFLLLFCGCDSILRQESIRKHVLAQCRGRVAETGRPSRKVQGCPGYGLHPAGSCAHSLDWPLLNSPLQNPGWIRVPFHIVEIVYFNSCVLAHNRDSYYSCTKVQERKSNT